MLHSILTLIVNTVASVLAGMLLLRFWMQAIRLRPPPAVAQFIFQLTDWLVRPLRKLLPGVGGYDWASLVAAFGFAILSTVVALWMAPDFSTQAVLLLALLLLVEWVLYGFMGVILIEVVFSWINPQAPLAPFVRALSDPLLRPLRRIIPLIGSIDLTPLVAFVLLRIALQLISALILPFA